MTEAIFTIQTTHTDKMASYEEDLVNFVLNKRSPDIRRRSSQHIMKSNIDESFYMESCYYEE
jgi:hypothetical protein